VTLHRGLQLVFSKTIRIGDTEDHNLFVPLCLKELMILKTKQKTEWYHSPSGFVNRFDCLDRACQSKVCCFF
jgi:hypothetical protein